MTLQMSAYFAALVTAPPASSLPRPQFKLKPKPSYIPSTYSDIRTGKGVENYSAFVDIIAEKVEYPTLPIGRSKYGKQRMRMRW
jgi:hypothetical protein